MKVELAKMQQQMASSSQKGPEVPEQQKEHAEAKVEKELKGKQRRKRL